MTISTTQIIQALTVHGGSIVFEMAFPQGNLKGNVISVVSPAFTAPIVIPREMFDDMLRQSYLRQYGETKDGKIEYVLTRDGEQAGWSGLVSIYGVKDGPQEHKGYAIDTITIEDAVQKLGLNKSQFVGGLDKPSPRFNADKHGSMISADRHVVAKIAVEYDGWKAGYYWLKDLTPTQVYERLGKAAA